MNKRKRGAIGEDLAAARLQQEGYTILDRNVTLHHGEIDIIAKEGKTIVFIEVKTRWSTAYGTPKEALTKTKQQILVRTALHYLTNHDKMKEEYRFDLISMLLDEKNRIQEWEHLKNVTMTHSYFL